MVSESVVEVAPPKLVEWWGKLEPGKGHGTHTYV